MSTTHPLETNRGTVTSWIPLTTPFSVNPSCSNIFLLDGISQDDFLSGYVDAKLVAFHPLYGSLHPSFGNCQPEEVMTWWNANYVQAFGQTSTSLMPLRCPDAWLIAATFVQSSISTQVMCCPSSYGFYNVNDHYGLNGGCVSTVRLGDVLTYVQVSISRAGIGFETPAMLSEDMSPTSLMRSLAPEQSVAIFETVTTLESSSLVRAIPIIGWNVQSTTAQSSNPQQTTIPGSVHRKDSLSKNTIAGISLVAGIVLFVVLFISWIIILRRRRHSANKANVNNELEHQQNSSLHGIETGGSDDDNSHQARELDDSQIINELSHTNRLEMDADAAAAAAAVVASMQPIAV